MNEFLQNNLFALILFLLFIIVLLIGVLTFIIFKLLAQKNVPQENRPVADSKPIVPHQAIVEKYSCHNHKDQPTIGSCLMCEDVFCENCLIEHEGMFFCKDHFRVYANHKWKQITDLKTSAKTPEEGLFIYELKREAWSKKGIPSFVLTHYKINVEDDLIESYIQLHVREEDEADFLKGLSKKIE
jgi:hypothetical protein